MTTPEFVLIFSLNPLAGAVEALRGLTERLTLGRGARVHMPALFLAEAPAPPFFSLPRPISDGALCVCALAIRDGCTRQVLNDATERVKEKSCYALESFCENLGDDIVPFLQPLLERLTHVLQTSKHATQEMAISALASVAMAAGAQFTPYFETVFGLMRVLLQQTGEQELLLRSRASIRGGATVFR